tara:strand:- start:4902 stop:5330 length:429 start_codon:yes stop_codon:yes gene_type:complete
LVITDFASVQSVTDINAKLTLQELVAPEHDDGKMQHAAPTIIFIFSGSDACKVETAPCCGSVPALILLAKPLPPSATTSIKSKKGANLLANICNHLHQFSRNASFECIATAAALFFSNVTQVTLVDKLRQRGIFQPRCQIIV